MMNTKWLGGTQKLHKYLVLKELAPPPYWLLHALPHNTPMPNCWGIIYYCKHHSCPQNNNYILIHRSFVFLALFNFHITLWNQHDHYASSLNTTPTTADTYFVGIFLSNYSPLFNDLLVNTSLLNDDTYTIIISKIVCIHSYIHSSNPLKKSPKNRVYLSRQTFFGMSYLFKGLISPNKYFSYTPTKNRILNQIAKRLKYLSLVSRYICFFFGSIT